MVNQVAVVSFTGIHHMAIFVNACFVVGFDPMFDDDEGFHNTASGIANALGVEVTEIVSELPDGELSWQKFGEELITKGKLLPVGTEQPSATDDFLTIRFDVDGSVTQTLKLRDPAYDESFLYDGLNNGMLATTLAHGDSPATIINVTSGEVIADIVAQESDGEYSDFEPA